jgi:hypothetical protein
MTSGVLDSLALRNKSVVRVIYQIVAAGRKHAFLNLLGKKRGAGLKLVGPPGDGANRLGRNSPNTMATARGRLLLARHLGRHTPLPNPLHIGISDTRVSCPIPDGRIVKSMPAVCALGAKRLIR